MEILAALIVALGFFMTMAMFDGEQERRHKELLAALAPDEAK